MPEANGIDQRPIVDVMIFLDRTAGLSLCLPVLFGTTIRGVKDQLASSDPTGSMHADEIELALPASAGAAAAGTAASNAPRAGRRLLDDEAVGEEHRELDLCVLPSSTGAAPLAQDTAATPADAAFFSADLPPSRAEGQDEAEVPSAADLVISSREALRQAAAEAMASGDLQLALARLEEALAGGGSVSLHCQRAKVVLEMGDALAAVKECTAALAIDPDSDRALRLRGRAYSRLERWAEADADLRESLKICFDEEADEECRKAAVMVAAAAPLEGTGPGRPQAAAPLPKYIWEILVDEACVRDGLSPFSHVLPQGLARGAVVEEVAIEGNNLKYRKLFGEGPEKGWVCVSVDGTPAACRTFDSELDGLGGEPPFPAMPPASGTPTAPVADLSGRLQLLKKSASEASEAGNADVALRLLTEAVVIGHSSAGALTHVRRAEVLLQLGRPLAATADCAAALAQNPDSGRALRTRARAFAALERWAEAHRDFQASLQVDHDEDAYEESLGVAARVCQSWEIVGEVDDGGRGLPVQEGADLGSPQLYERLQRGAVVWEVSLAGDRLHYQKLSGRGQRQGWISIVCKGKVLACRLGCAAARAAAAGAHPEEQQEEAFPATAPLDVEHLDDDALDLQSALKQEASDALEDGLPELALEKLTAAIGLGCPGSLLYGRRAELLLQLGRPRAAANDATAALATNPDSAKAFGLRARARARLKQWPEAHADFQESLRIDFDDVLYEESQEAAAKARSIRDVATASRALEEAAQARRRAEEGREAQRRGREEEKARIAKDKVEAERAVAALDPRTRNIFEKARAAGWMTDFVGTKRGRCHCNRCDVYCWRPVRLSSCAAADVSVQCVVCGCPPDRHAHRGTATQADLVA